MKTELKDWLKRRIGYKNKPKIEIRHRIRKNGWTICECECKCHKMSNCEDNLCIECFLGNHRNSYKPVSEDNNNGSVSRR